jgi:copper chaperone CopZ
VRSALLEVPGVTRAQVNLQTGEVLVTYDPGAATVDAMLTAVDSADGPQSPRQYRAQVKEGPRPASTQ